jgi:hypothetical protein
VKDHRGNLDVFRDVIKPPAADHLAVAEDALAACHLGMKEFGTHRIPFAVSPKRTANGCKQQLRQIKRPPPKKLNHLEKEFLQQENRQLKSADAEGHRPVSYGCP